MGALQIDKRYTYSDYVKWDNDERYELMDGLPYAMSSPSWLHQDIAGEIFRQMANFLRGKPCKAFIAPFDVRLNADKSDNTVVQPDITIVCDRSKLERTGCKGVPDMVVEILSPSSVRMDRVTKYAKYRLAGVHECWIVDPIGRTVEQHILNDGQYYKLAYGENTRVPVHILTDCGIDFSDVFEAKETEEEQ